MKDLKSFKYDIKPIYFLVLGILAISITHMTYSVDIFAWISNVPFLIYLSITKGWKSRLLFIFSLIIAWSFVVLKIISAPIPFAMIFLFSIPISLFHLPAYLIWDKFKKQKWSFLLFPSILTIMEWIQYTYTPFASWGVMAYSQSQSLNIIQFVSIFGMAGLSFLIYYINISITKLIISKKINFPSFYLPISIVLIVIVFGTLRINLKQSEEKKMIKVATVVTTSKVSGYPLPSLEENKNAISEMIIKTKKAADDGVKIVVWNEASFYCLLNSENEIINSIKLIAREKKITMVVSYVLPISKEPFKYKNKFVFINNLGETEYSYLKHEPVPGEPAIKGTNDFQVIKVSESKIGGAICYDYDFPYIAQEFGKLKADIVALPSSDWKGIDPLHSRMAAFRAIEQGHSIIRSTRFGLSAIISPYGEMINQLSSFDDENKLLISNVPTKGFRTTYSKIGDLFIYLNFGFIFLFIIVIFKKKSFNKKLN